MAAMVRRTDPSRLGIAFAALIVAGLPIGAWAISASRPGNFNIRPEPEEGGRLVTAGPYRWIRHPLYSGTLLSLWAAPTMSRGHLLLAAVLTLYLAIGYRFEERDLARRHGASYLAYRARVPAFVPRLRPSAHR